MGHFHTIRFREGEGIFFSHLLDGASLPSLQTLCIADGVQYSVDLFRKIFALPALTDLAISSSFVIIQHLEKSLPVLIQGAKKLRCLRICGSHFETTEVALISILQSVDKCRIESLHLVKNNDFPRRYPNGRPGTLRFISALAASKLKSLVIKNWMTEADCDCFFTDLKSNASLTSLKIQSQISPAAENGESICPIAERISTNRTLVHLDLSRVRGLHSPSGRSTQRLIIAALACNRTLRSVNLPLVRTGDSPGSFVGTGPYVSLVPESESGKVRESLIQMLREHPTLATVTFSFEAVGSIIGECTRLLFSLSVGVCKGLSQINFVQMKEGISARSPNVQESAEIDTDFRRQREALCLSGAVAKFFEMNSKRVKLQIQSAYQPLSTPRFMHRTYRERLLSTLVRSGHIELRDVLQEQFK